MTNEDLQGKIEFIINNHQARFFRAASKSHK